MSNIKRVFLLVLDSFGIGELPDAAAFGDEGSNTLAAVANNPNFNCPNLTKLGLFNIDGIGERLSEKAVGNPIAAYGRMAEKSVGKDTTTGHFEISGIILDKPFPTYPDGFPKEIIDKFESETGRGTLCNKPYSGTAVIKEYGREHIETGKLIVYTSADSVFQIAAHEGVVPRDELYRYCKIARKILCREHAVGRVIARPFVGEYPNYTRTDGRHDFSVEPEGDNMLTAISDAGLDVIAIGKTALRFSCVGLIFLASSVAANMLFQSIRKSLIASILAMMRSGLMFIPVLIIGYSLKGLWGIQAAQGIADVLSGLVSIPFAISFLRKDFSKELSQEDDR